MKRLTCEQRSAEWYQARLGIPTTSQFRRFITPAKGSYAAGSTAYACELVAERFLGVDANPVPADSYWMQRGVELEPEARRAFELVQDVEVTDIGIVLNHGAGASPDGEVTRDGELWSFELKCPSPAKHVAYLADGGVPLEYKPQVHGHMVVGEYVGSYFMSYCPGMPPLIVEVWGEDYTNNVRDCLARFVSELEELALKVGAPANPPELKVL